LPCLIDEQEHDTDGIFAELTERIYAFSASFFRPASAPTTSFRLKISRKKIDENIFHIFIKNKDCSCCEK